MNHKKELLRSLWVHSTSGASSGSGWLGSEFRVKGLGSTSADEVGLSIQQRFPK